MCVSDKSVSDRETWFHLLFSVCASLTLVRFESAPRKVYSNFCSFLICKAEAMRNLWHLSFGTWWFCFDPLWRPSPPPSLMKKWRRWPQVTRWPRNNSHGHLVAFGYLFSSSSLSLSTSQAAKKASPRPIPPLLEDLWNKNSFASILYTLTTTRVPKKTVAQVKPPSAVCQASKAWVYKGDLEKK